MVRYPSGESRERVNAGAGPMVPMKQHETAIHFDPGIMGGTAVFVGTRVPFETLLDYLKTGQPLSEFLEDFPTVTRD